MPSLSCSRDELTAALKGAHSEEELADHLFNFGVELDDIYEENGLPMYKFDIAANRYDLLCTEGLATALNAYLGHSCYEEPVLSEPVLTVHKLPTHERQSVACAVIRGIHFTPDRYNSFIAYQDKLHLSIGRNRSIVSMGTHDLGRIRGDIVYKTEALGDIRFVPLNSADQASIRGTELRGHFEQDKKLSKYFSLLSAPDRAVVFRDSEKVLSVPPIINSDCSKISMETEDIFVEVTGTDFIKVNTALKLLLCNFRGERIEAVRIREATEDGLAGKVSLLNMESGEDGGAKVSTVLTTPVFYNRKFLINSEKISKKLNLSLNSDELKNLLKRMMYSAEAAGMDILVRVPDVRSDVLHECDIIEDIAIAYGFNNFEKRIPLFHTIGSESPLNKFTDKLRTEFALCGFVEALTLTLLSRDENFVAPERQAVLSNPKSKEYEVVRTSLLPGILKSVASNLHGKIPIRVFEAADVVLLDDDQPEGASNSRRLCGCIAANTALLEELQGPLTLLLSKCGFAAELKYEHLAVDDKRYVRNQSATVSVSGVPIGSIGVLHPRVCNEFRIPYAASSFELDVQRLYEMYSKHNQ